MNDKHNLTDFQKTAALRDETRELNACALVAVMQEYGITIPAKDFGKWRPTVRSRGQLAGLAFLGDVHILCTDGVVAHFLLVDARTTLHGHVSNFTGEVKPLFSMPAKGQAKDVVKKPRKSRATKPDAVAQAKELLATLLKQ